MPLSLPTAPPRPAYAPFPNVASPHIHALYLHVPFCSSKCHYCDFYSLAGQLDHTDQFLQAFEKEIHLTREHLPTITPSTLFIGGGTPTLLSPPHLDHFLALLFDNIDTQNLTEATIEANPNTFDAARAKILKSRGINRISFGAQSFIPAELATLQRDHDPVSVPTAIQIAKDAGLTNYNIDLIFGIPGQTLDSWKFSLDQALSLNPSHLSCYSLTYEPSTAMTARLHRGEFAPIDEELELAMFDHVYAHLRTSGFTRYEVSNYARPGKECQHNIHYWKGSNWLSWGPSAAGHLNGHRYKNVASLTHYLEALTPNEGQAILPLTQMEHLTPLHWAGEVATFWLRLAEGLNYAEFESRTSINAQPLLEPILRPYVDMGFTELTPTHARLTEKAIPVSNTILRNVLAAFK